MNEEQKYVTYHQMRKISIISNRKVKTVTKRLKYNTLEFRIYLLII